MFRHKNDHADRITVLERRMNWSDQIDTRVWKQLEAIRMLVRILASDSSNPKIKETALKAAFGVLCENCGDDEN
mgnify:CR=1 FL=1